MSVFQLQEWWGVRVTPEDEDFDLSCFAVGNVDNSNPASDKIAIGSQQGVLRIYHPTRSQYRVEDLVYEGVLNAPILQVLIGRFIPSNDTLGLAILHPRELVVYEVIPQGKEGRINFHNLQKLYKHDLGVGGKHFTAYNMCHGPFGGSRGRDMIVVQSLDGKLQIFEQSANAFSRQLADCLIPGPIVYLPKLDAFVTTNHACQAECYRYQVLASAQNDSVAIKSNDFKGSSDYGAKSEYGAALSMQKVKSALVEWSATVGESCRQILVGNFSAAADQPTSFARAGGSSTGGGAGTGLNSEVLLVCDKSLFLVKADTGGVIQQKRLERADAACACIVTAEGPGAPNNFMVAGQDGTVQVYVGFNLAWAARMPTPPVHIGVGTFGGLKGMIVAVDDMGRLSVSYLGTKPPVTAVLTHVRDLDYDKIDEEHRGLLQVIRDAQSENRTEPVEKLLIKSQIPRVFDMENPLLGDSTGSVQALPLPKTLVPLFPASGPAASVHLSGGSAEQVVKMTIRLYLSYSGDRHASNVSLVVSPPAHVHVVPQNIVLSKVSGLKSTPVVVKLHVYAVRGALAAGLQCMVTASYQSLRGEPRVSAHYIALPLALAMRPRAPTKSAPCKVVLDTEFPAAPLTELFVDLMHAYTDAGHDLTEALGANAVQAMGFQLFHQPPAHATSASQLVSILVSKNAGRYRLQAESFPALLLMVEELERRLTARIASQPNANLSVMSPSSKQTADAPRAAADGLPVRFMEALPLDDFCRLAEQHLRARQLLAEKLAALETHSAQFRMIEKRLLVRFKDRNPTPLHGLELILKEEYEKILAAADEVEVQQAALRSLGVELEAFAKLLAALAAMKFNLAAADRLALQSHLCPDLRGGEQGWQETVLASLSFALRTTLSAKGKEGSAASASASIGEMPKNIDGLSKSLVSLFEKLEKGGRLAVAPSPAKASK